MAGLNTEYKLLLSGYRANTLKLLTMISRTKKLADQPGIRGCQLCKPRISFVGYDLHKWRGSYEQRCIAEHA